MTTSPSTLTDTRGHSIDPPRHSRGGAVAGIAFVGFFVLGVVASNVPADNASDAAWLKDYTGTRNHVGHLRTAYCLVLAGLSLMWFLTALWERVCDADATRTPSPVPVVAAGMAGALISVGGVLMGVVSIAALRGYPQVIRLGSDGGFAMVSVGGMLAAALSLAWICLEGRRVGVLGTKLARTGIAVAVVLLAAIAFIPIAALLLWVLVTSVWLLRHDTRAASA